MAKRTLTKGQHIFGICFFSLVAIACLFGLWFYANAVIASYEASDWPVVQGNIISSDAVIGCGKGRSYRPHVNYRYTVGETIYAGKRIAFGSGGCGSFESAREIANRYPANTAVTVHYNRTQPSEAALMVDDVLSDTYVGILLTGAGLLMSGGVVLTHIRTWRRLSEPSG